MDRDKTGTFTYADLIDFASLCAAHDKRFSPHEYQAQVSAFCTLKMYDDLSTTDAQERFCEWFLRLLVRQPTTVGDTVYVRREQISSMYDLLTIRQAFGMSFQDFFELLQRHGEELGTLQLDDEALDDLVPLAVVTSFASHMIQGYLNILADLNFQPGIADQL